MMLATAAAVARAPRAHTRRHVTLAMVGALTAGTLPRLGKAELDVPGVRIARLAERLAKARVPYLTGGLDRQGFDCSGLVWYVHHAVGVEVPRRAEEQSAAAMPVDPEALLPGDLLFFRLRSSARVDHVAIYIGPDQLIHASLLRHAVVQARLDDNYFAPRVASAGRLWAPSLLPAEPPEQAVALF